MTGAPTGTRTPIGRLGGNCSILLSYERIQEQLFYHNKSAFFPTFLELLDKNSQYFSVYLTGLKVLNCFLNKIRRIYPEASNQSH